ncbi:MAG: thioredoxin family protein [Gemmatimonadales bacterium]|jgi:hypothetical protein|nr:MAG: thioredoxin family protein [Gemmatimonadales bacterium]
MTFHPSLVPPDIRERFAAAPDFAGCLEAVEANRELWRGLFGRARVASELEARAAGVPGTFHFLVPSEDWCGDAVNTLPMVARFVEALPAAKFRILGREDNPDLMDSHLTDGRSRSIPVVIVYDDDFRELGWWGPRPAELQAWVLGAGQALSKSDRYREVRREYARDRGQTVVREILDILTSTPAPTLSQEASSTET